MRKTYDLKQVKISTSILWILNKAETRTVFYNSSDIFANLADLHLHSLIVRGLTSGELYFAALSKLFPNGSSKPIKTRDFQSIINLLIELDTSQLPEVAVIRQKNCAAFIGSLTKQEPFELTEHLKLIDALMSLYLSTSELIDSIPTIIGKLCDYRPNTKEPKKLLEIWFKCVTCLSLSKHNIQDTGQLIKSLVIMENTESLVKKFLDSIKFSDKIALIMSYESEALEIEKEFVFDYSNDGSTNRDNVKHNFVTVIKIFRKHFPKILEDFKELMLVLNSSHIQISANLQINIDLFICEFFQNLERISNHGNRTFRTGAENSETKEMQSSRTFRIENSSSGSKDKMGMYNTLNKLPVQSNEKNSKFGTIGTYSGKKLLKSEYNNSSKLEELSMNWGSQKLGNNLLYTNRKSSVPNGLNWAGVNKNVSSNLLFNDGTLKSKFIERKASVDKIERQPNECLDDNQTSWVLQSSKNDKSNRSFTSDISNNQEIEGPRQKLNETRLLLNMKRQEIEGNRRQIHQRMAKERQLVTDKVFKDVTMGISQTDDSESNNHRPKRVSDMKRNREHKTKPDLSRSRSQDFSKSSVEDISDSLNQLKSEISKLTSEQARLSAKIAENKMDNTETFSPRSRSTMSKEDGFDGKAGERASIRSMPISWHPYNNYGNDEMYNNYNMPYGNPYPYPIDPNSQRFYPSQFNRYPYGYSTDIPMYQMPPETLSINHHQTTKSLRDSINSRPSSPGAMSEPVKTIEVLPEKSMKPIETEPLTIQNLMKHNKSMDTLSNNVIHLDNSNKSTNQNSIDKKHLDPSNNSIKAPPIENPIPSDSYNESIDELKKNVPDKSSPIPRNNGKTVDESPKVEIKASIDKEIKNDENSKIFFVSFEHENGKKTLKKPKFLTDKESNSSNNNVDKTVENSMKSKPPVHVLKNVEKPLAFVIKVDDNDMIQPVASSNENTLIIKEKLLHLEKREQERKEKLEKIKEITRLENEKRLQKELEKEKLKEERKRKRDAIFEAHLEKKLEKETFDSHKTTKDTKIIRKPVRATSAVPTMQRNELNNEIILDIATHPDSSFTDLITLNSKRERIPTICPGPKLFVEPKSKSNKGVILNAIKYCCLAGRVNESLKQQTVEELERFDASHFMVLMRGGCQYRSLYRFEIESECLTKLTGVGPKKITNKMVDKFFKYNSGAKKFMEITSTNHLSTVIDGITIFNTLWKTSTALNNQLISSETSSQAEHISL